MDHRAARMKKLILDTFLSSLEHQDFSSLTVEKLSETAMINRSTFYRYFEDKYQLRDMLLDELISDFTNHLEVDFLDLDIERDWEYTNTLRKSLESIYTRRRELDILWNQHALGRNLFEEMIISGAEKLKRHILQNRQITDEKKQYADWYARLLLNNMLVSIRWWFSNSDWIDAAKMTELMKQHMAKGTIPTLKGQR